MKLYGIQSLRGLAASAVVLYHALTLTGVTVPILSVGVSVFFVISGVVLSLGQRDGDVFGAFLWRRFARVVPMYWLCTLAAIAYLFARYQQLPALEHVGRSLGFLPPPAGQEFPILYVGWSLNYEMFFYLLMAGTMAALPARLGAVVLITLICFLGAVGDLSWLGEAGYYLKPKLLFFAAGVAIGLFLREGGRFTQPLAMLSAATAMTLFVFNWDGHLPTLIGRGVPSVLLVIGFLGMEGLTIVTNPLSRGAGNASYTIYLTHPFAVWGIDWAGWHSWTGVAVAVAASFALAWTIHRNIEEPLLNWLRQPTWRRSGIATAGKGNFTA